MKNILTLIIIVVLYPLSCFAGWNGPSEIISGTWGTGENQFGLQSGDTIAYDVYPMLLSSIVGNRIFINDDANKRGLVYSMNGQFLEVVPIQKTIEGKFEVYRWTKYYCNGSIIGYVGDNSFWTKDEGKYYKYDSSFNLLQTSTYCPLEVGMRTFKCKQGIPTETKCSRPHYEVEYPDAVYVFETNKENMKGDLKKQTRINNNLIMDNQGGMVYAYGVTSTIPASNGNKEKRLLGWKAAWQKPEDDYENISRGKGVEPKTIMHAQYGDSEIGPDGSIYTWMRSETHYKILKWTWQNN